MRLELGRSRPPRPGGARGRRSPARAARARRGAAAPPRGPRRSACRSARRGCRARRSRRRARARPRRRAAPAASPARSRCRRARRRSSGRSGGPPAQARARARRTEAPGRRAVSSRATASPTMPPPTTRTSQRPGGAGRDRVLHDRSLDRASPLVECAHGGWDGARTAPGIADPGGHSGRSCSWSAPTSSTRARRSSTRRASPAARSTRSTTSASASRSPRRSSIELIDNAEPDLVNARPILISVTSGIIGTKAFEAIFKQAAERAHRTVFTRDGDSLVLSLADGAALAIDGLRTISPKLAKEVPEGRHVPAQRPDRVEGRDRDRLCGRGRALPRPGAPRARAGPPRRGGLGRSRPPPEPPRGRVSVAVSFGFGLAVLLVGRAIALAQVGEEMHDAGAAVWDAYLGGLRTWLILGLGAALLLAAAVSTRRRIDASDPLRRMGQPRSRARSSSAARARPGGRVRSASAC